VALGEKAAVAAVMDATSLDALFDDLLAGPRGRSPLTPPQPSDTMSVQLDRSNGGEE